MTIDNSTQPGEPEAQPPSAPEPSEPSAGDAKLEGHDVLKIGEFARLAGTNLRTLRYYEELGLMTPATRSRGGFRYYRKTDINRLNMIRSLQELGLQLDRIKELMATRQHLSEREGFLEGVRAALSEQDRLLQERVEALGERRSKIATAMQKLAECQTCKHMPSIENNFCEPCINTGDPLPADVSALY